MRRFLPVIAGILTVLFLSMFFGFFGETGWGITAASTGAGILVYTALKNKGSSRSIPIADERLRDSLLAVPAAGVARIIVYRAAAFLKEGFMGATLGIDLTLDGAPLTQLTNPRMTAIDVTPGEHLLGAGTGTKQNVLPISVAAGELAIFQVTLPKGSMGDTFGLIRETDNAAAVTKLAAVPMVAPDRPGVERGESV